MAFVDQALAFVTKLLEYLHEAKAAEIVSMVKDFLGNIGGSLGDIIGGISLL